MVTQAHTHTSAVGYNTSYEAILTVGKQIHCRYTHRFLKPCSCCFRVTGRGIIDW